MKRTFDSQVKHIIKRINKKIQPDLKALKKLMGGKWTAEIKREVS